MQDTDWRIASALFFYFPFALLGAAMSTTEVYIFKRYKLSI